jgi:hypothetical protein
LYASIRSPQKLLFNRPERGALPVTSGLFLWRVVSVWSGDPFKRRVVMGGLFYTPWTIVAWTHCETVHPCRAVQLVSENARIAGCKVRSDPRLSDMLLCALWQSIIIIRCHISVHWTWLARSSTVQGHPRTQAWSGWLSTSSSVPVNRTTIKIQLAWSVRGGHVECVSHTWTQT